MAAISSTENHHSSNELTLLLDIDGVLNRLGRKKKKKQKGDDVVFTSDLICVPSVAVIDALLSQLDVHASFDATLLHHLCHLCHSAAGCCGSGSGSSGNDSSKQQKHGIIHDKKTTVQSPTTDSHSMTSLQIVLSSTWRLQSESMSIVQQLLERLRLISATVAVTESDVTDAAAASSSPSSTPLSSSSASPSSGCRLMTVRPLGSTPDLGGWGTRLDEILAFLQMEQQRNQQQRLTSRFLIIDDMELYGTLNLQQHHPSSQLEQNPLHRLMEYCQERTIKIDGNHGFDAATLGATMKNILNRIMQPIDSEFDRLLQSSFEVPRLPE